MIHDMTRAATLEDSEAIQAFNIAMALETEGKSLCPETISGGVRALIEDPSKGFYLVAERKGAIVGSLLVTKEWSDWRNGSFWWIQSVYVSPEYRRQGVYKALHFYAAEDARQKGNVCGLRLYVDKDNTIAQGVYAGLRMRPTHYDMYEIDFDARPTRGPEPAWEPEEENDAAE